MSQSQQILIQLGGGEKQNLEKNLRYTSFLNVSFPNVGRPPCFLLYVFTPAP